MKGTGQGDWKTAIREHKKTPAYTEHMKNKHPKKATKAWHTRSHELLVDFIRSTPYSSQTKVKITTPAQAEQAEGNRLLTYLFYKRSEAESKKTARAGKTGKGSKAPEATETSEDPTDDEE